ncbi:IS3 family transposase [Nonomuraea sp. CA-141351]|uniref:IS3 family transposase n=1 Tax=Nonomuraea sp. CA-141351 TaxID=3239996 RepID=UPI003D94D552
MTLAKYELIDAEKACHSIVKMCAWLGVSRSGYYEWRERPASATAQRRALLTALVAEIFAGSHETYGYRRVHAALARRGEHCSPELVRALMREQGLIPAQVRAFRLMSLWPQTSWAMCGGMPFITASVTKILRRSCGANSSGRPLASVMPVAFAARLSRSRSTPTSTATAAFSAAAQPCSNASSSDSTARQPSKSSIRHCVARTLAPARLSGVTAATSIHAATAAMAIATRNWKRMKAASAAPAVYRVRAVTTARISTPRRSVR